MTRIMIMLLTGLSLTACATGPTAFGPAQGSGNLGFKQTQLENDRFRVSFTAKNPDEAQDYALLRAAQITLDEGYSHFEVLNGNLSGNSGRSGVSSSVGVGFGGGRGFRRGGGTSVGIGLGLNDVGRTLNGDRVTDTIQIKLLNSGSANNNVFNAQTISDSIRPTVFTP